MNDRLASRIAWGIWGVSAALTAAGLWLQPPANALPGLILFAYPTVGAPIASRHPANPIGWIFLALGLPWGLDRLTTAYGTMAFASTTLPGGAVALWLSNWLFWISEAALIGSLLLVFPNGQLPSRRWRPALWLIACGALLTAAGMALTPGPLENHPIIDNPFGVQIPGPRPSNLPYAIGGLGFGLFSLGLIGAGASLVARFRRANGLERRQLKWLAAAAGLMAFVFLVNLAWLSLAQVTDVRVPGAPGAALSVASAAGLYLGLAGIPTAAALAIVRHRLFDIERLINRTVVYGTLAGFITVAYLAIVVGVGTALGASARADLFLSIVATAVVALAFQPVRDRVQHVANRLVYGQAAAPDAVLAEFSRRMAGALSVAEILPQTAEAAARGTRATRARARLMLPGSTNLVADWPPGGEVARFDWTVPVLHQGEPIGEISLANPPGGTSPAEERLLTDLASQAGLAFHNVRLAGQLEARLAELSRQADELRASRERIVAAQDAERRRLARDIHDGAQQYLVAIAITLDLARHLIPADPGRAAELLETAGQQAAQTQEALRDLARGVLPQLLIDHGLVAALQAHVSRLFPAVRLETDPLLSAKRLPQGVEAAIYFACLEALQNAAKHAPGAEVAVSVLKDDGTVAFDVSDDGQGFAPDVPPGLGLQNMTDRLAAVGGSLTVDSAPGRGTTVHGRVPINATSVADQPTPSPAAAPV
jgi:signal transduction histidine kinase